MMSVTRSRSTILAYTLVGALGLPIVLLSWTGALTFATDDYWQLRALLGDSYPGGPVLDDYFRFFSGVDQHNCAAMQVGVVPWYADTSVKITFWRPFTSALHRLDFELFGIAGTGPKIHSLLWYVALVTVVSWLYCRLMTDQVAGFALILFAIAAAHWQIVAWIAARNASITAVFGVGAVFGSCAISARRIEAWLGTVPAPVRTRFVGGRGGAETISSAGKPYHSIAYVSTSKATAPAEAPT